MSVVIQYDDETVMNLHMTFFFWDPYEKVDFMNTWQLITPQDRFLSKLIYVEMNHIGLSNFSKKKLNCKKGAIQEM